MTNEIEKLPPRLANIVRPALKVKSFLMSIAALIMALTFFFVVILRYGFNADLFAYEEWLLLICFWLYFVSGAVGTWERSHINADVLSYVLSSRANYARVIAVHFIELAVVSVLFYWSIMMTLDELSFYPALAVTNALRIPLIIPRFAMVVGFFFMTFYTLIHIYVDLKFRVIGEDSQTQVL